jgi:serine protease inhibitor
MHRKPSVSRPALPALVLSLVLLTGCDRITGPGEPVATWTKVPLDQRVTDAYTDFSFELFRRLRADAAGSNVFVSGTSAAVALALAYNGAVGQTAVEMADVLGVGGLTREVVNETNRLWLNALRETGDPAAEVALANSVWYRQSYPIRDSFRDRMHSFYDAEIEPITTAGAINAWVAKATRGRIEEIVAGEIPGTVVAYLINALYFKADWTIPFDERRTRNAAFRRPDGSAVTVPMMSREGSFEARSGDGMHMLRLPYGAKRFSLILALPEEGSDLAAVAASLEGGRWRSWMTQFAEVQRLVVELPRLEIEWESSLARSLHAMGMQVPFEPALADFSEMFQARGPWIGDVLQKTYLRIDEKGTEAAAVTSIPMVTSMPPTLTFDRPFFLAIYDHATETVLFLGQITDPTG